MNKIILLLLALLMSRQSFTQQLPATISGVVTSADNKPVAGLMLRWRQAGTATNTNSDGTFSIQLTTISDTLETISTGYEHRLIPVSVAAGNARLVLRLDGAKALEEVLVNTGYQTLPKERATGSFTSVSKTLFNQQSGTTVISRLESVTNGLYVDRSNPNNTKLVIRGISTIRGVRSPLIVLNDFPYAGNLDDINPNDVESITILKDAAAASIWGSQAGNGVIVITTKKGQYNQPMRGTLSVNTLITQKPSLDNIKTFGPADNIEIDRFLFSKGFYNTMLNSTPWIAVPPVITILKKQQQGLLTQAQADEQIAAIGQHDIRNDFRDRVYQQGTNYQRALSLSGGGNNIGWTMSAGWDRNEGTLHEKYERYNLRSTQLFKLTKKLQLNTGIDYTLSNSTTGSAGYGTLKTPAAFFPMYTSFADASGNASAVPYSYNKAYTDTVYKGKLLDWGYYPLTDWKENISKTKLQAMLLDAGAVYTVLPGFTLNLKYQYGKQATSGDLLHTMLGYFTRDAINTYSQRVIATGALNYNLPQGAIEDFSDAVLETQNLRMQANYSKRWNKHEVNFISGAEMRQLKISSHGNRMYGIDPETGSTKAVDLVTRFPNFLTGSTSSIPGSSGIGGGVNRYVSFYGNGAYTYLNRYTVSASARRDASNLFGASNNNKWSPLWSAGLAWDIAKENFYKGNWGSALKLRATYGVSGNADPSRSAVTTLMYNYNNVLTQSTGALISQYSNPNLSWEKVKMLNIGLEYSTPGKWLDLSIEYYHKRGVNLFGNQPIDYTGLPSDNLIINAASISGRGWDIGLSSHNLKKRVDWRTDLNLNFNHDKVTVNNIRSTQASNYVGPGGFGLPGQAVYALYAYKWAGLDSLTGDPRGYFGGAISKNYNQLTGSLTTINDLQYIGTAMPTVTASLGNTFQWKQFAFTIRFTGKFGYYFLRESVDYNGIYRGSNNNADYARRWQKPGDESTTQVPSQVYPAVLARDNFYRFSSILYSRADHIRLQYITVGYTLKKPSIYLYANINNLGTVWVANKYHIDPDYNSSIEPSKNIALGLKYNF